MTHQQHLNIIFDLDGTLLNTLDDLTASTNHALQVCGYPPHTTQEVRLMVGNGIAKLIERAVPQGTSEASTLHCLDIFRQHYTEHCLDRTLPYPGVTEMLSEFKRRNLGLAIVSNKLQPAVSELRERFFADCINIAVGETKQVRRKPAPDMLLLVMRLMGASEADTIYVGDSDVDILTARNASLPCISVAWGFRDKDFLIRHGATTIAESPAQLLEIIESLPLTLV